MRDATQVAGGPLGGVPLLAVPTLLLLLALISALFAEWRARHAATLDALASYTLVALALGACLSTAAFAVGERGASP